MADRVRQHHGATSPAPPPHPELDEELIDFVSWLTICGCSPQVIVKILRGANDGKVPSIFLIHQGKQVARIAMHSILYDQAQWNDIYGIPVGDVILMRHMLKVFPEEVGHVLSVCLEMAFEGTDVQVEVDEDSCDGFSRIDLSALSQDLGREYASLAEMTMAGFDMMGENSFQCVELVVDGTISKAVFLGDGFLAIANHETPALCAANLIAQGKKDHPAVRRYLFYVDGDGNIFANDKKEFIDNYAKFDGDVGPDAREVTRLRVLKKTRRVFTAERMDQWERVREGYQ